MLLTLVYLLDVKRQKIGDHKSRASMQDSTLRHGVGHGPTKVLSERVAGWKLALTGFYAAM